MKKTTTRLATIAAVLVMSAFAIVLAQHDARKRNSAEEPLAVANLAAQPEQPLDIDNRWASHNAIVRGNNDRFANRPEDQEVYASYRSDEPPSLPQFQPDQSKLDAPASAFPAEPSGFPNSNFPASLPEISDLNVETYPASSGAAEGYGDGSQDVVLAAQEVQQLPPWASGEQPMPSIPSSNMPNGAPSTATLNNPQPVGNPLGTNPVATPGVPAPSFDDPPTYGQNNSPSFPSPSIPAPNHPSPNDVASASSHAISGSANTGSFGSLASAGARAELISNQPGSRYLDGSQNPILQIQKQAPEEIQVGKKATFVITVRNAGNAPAHDVTVVDRIPRGARFSESSPAISPTAEGILTWNLGEMGAGDERTIHLQIIPEVEGEVGSVASVHFAAQASVRTIATLPQLILEVESVGPVIIGQPQQIRVTVQNTGSGVARGVRLEADIPAQLRHESGETQLEAFVGDLRPNESRPLTLNVAAVQPGQSQCVLRAVNDDGVQAERAIAVDVRTPQLAATISGPSLRYLERQANYQIVVTNSGTAIARNLDFVVHLPVGLQFVSVDIPQASYNPQSHSISLGLAELDSSQAAPFSITVLPVQLGPQVIRVNATGDLNISAEAKAQVTVAGLAELAFKIGQDNGTVEVGATTTYAVEVSNIGNQADRNVQLVVQLPEGSNLLQVDAPVEYQVEAGRIVFAPVAEMRNRDTKTFRFQIQHNRAGNQVVRSQLTSENWPVAVVKEEGTLVYNDRN